MTSEQRRDQLRALAEAAQRDLMGAWLAVRPRRRIIELLRGERKPGNGRTVTLSSRPYAAESQS